MKELLCELCGEVVAVFDPKKLRRPIFGDMFQAKDAAMPSPFEAEADWEYMFCPYGPGGGKGHRIFAFGEGTPWDSRLGPNYLLTPQGPWRVGAEEKTYTCEECGRMFTAAIALVGHKRSHKKKEAA